MRKIKVFGLETVAVEGRHPYSGRARPRESSKICVTVTDIKSTCEESNLDSQYIALGEVNSVYGEATSVLDLALERAFSVMVNDETAEIDISMPKRFLCEATSEDLSLVCKVHLKITEMGKAVYKLNVEEKLALALKYKNLGVDLYREGSTQSLSCAYLFFSQSVKWLSMIGPNDADDKSNDVKALKMQCYNNLALYHLNKKHYPYAVEAATKVLGFESTNVKARYRRAIANTELQNYEAAEEDIKLALREDPNNGPIKKQREELKKRQRAISEKYALGMKKFLG